VLLLLLLVYRRIKQDCRTMKLSLCFLHLLTPLVSAYELRQAPSSRRALLERTAGGLLGAAAIGFLPPDALASGGATAGKYTTIPIAKRRYYGRVQQGVHDFVSASSCPWRRAPCQQCPLLPE
jgi:hypothetical protein